MSYVIELLNQEGRVVVEPRKLLDLADPFIKRLLGDGFSSKDAFLLLYLIPSGENDLPGEPHLSYRSKDVGYAKLGIVRSDKIFYQHPHTIGEIVGQGIRQWLAELDEPDAVTAYRLTGPNIKTLRDRATPEVAGVADIHPYAEGEQPTFRIRPLPPPTPEPRTLASFNCQPIEAGWLKSGRTDFVKVLVDDEVHEELINTFPFSSDVEEGGFLVGHVYEDADQAGTYLIRVTAALPAKQTGASLLHFTFTGDSFDHVKRILDRERQGEQILGWYHTHLFAATEDMGLSTIDFRLHFTTFRIPWQVAGLVNIDGQKRVLRFYVRRNNTMELCPYQAVDREL